MCRGERCAEALHFPGVCIFPSGASLCPLSPDPGVCIHPSPDLVLAETEEHGDEDQEK